MTALDQLRFLFVTGKGGVGKTTICAALARHFADRGRRVLLAVSGAEERFTNLLGGGPIRETISELSPGLSAVLLKPEVAFREYGLLVLKSERLTNALFDNKYVQGFFKGAPGLKEWAMLGKAWYHASETLEGGRPRFDVVLFDAPATGHALDMLRVPKVIIEVSPPGVLRSDAQRAWDFFRDPRQSGVVVATLPEEMPTNETVELVTAVRGELGLPVAALAVNGVVQELFGAAGRAELAKLPVSESPAEDPAERALESAVRRALRERVQSESLVRLRELGAPELRLPWIAGGVDSPAALSRLASCF
ncbi:MAG TPA: ArsA family ATPase [Polyangiaceae bacterium]|nr:ArsA family ATPase [Polyangiaceae bacterium]